MDKIYNVLNVYLPNTIAIQMTRLSMVAAYSIVITVTITMDVLSVKAQKIHVLNVNMDML